MIRRPVFRDLIFARSLCHRDRETQLLAIAHWLIAAAELGLKDHDRLAARQMMERKLAGRRTSSKLRELIELVMAQTDGLGRHRYEDARGDAVGGAADC